jgi:membrane-associated phospholipid phosphatase
VAIWAFAGAIPVFVAFSRMYRGMHHPLDVLGGVVIGICSVAALVLVCREAGLAAAKREVAEDG